MLSKTLDLMENLFTDVVSMGLSLGSYGGSVVTRASSASKSILETSFVPVLCIGDRSPKVDTDALVGLCRLGGQEVPFNQSACFLSLSCTSGLHL